MRQPASRPLLSLLSVAALALAGAACGRGEPDGAAAVAEEAATPAPARPTNEALYAEQLDAPGRGLDAAAEAEAVQQFLRVWSKHKPVFKSHYLGVRTYQNPLDAWVVQEVITEVAPDVLVEAGTAAGGSALLWATILQQVKPGARVITIDIEDQREQRAKDHRLARQIDFLLGSSTDPAIVAEVRRRVEGKRVLVLLDSLHTREHIAAELAAYAPLVPVGSYVIVQDTPLGGLEAIDAFLAANRSFVADRSRERFSLTDSIKGYLKRVR